MEFDDDPVLAALDRMERLVEEALGRVERLHRELPAQIVDQSRAELEGVRALAADSCGEPPLSVAEVAARLGRKRRWVYDHQDALGVVRHDGWLAFPAARIEEVRSRGLSVVPQQPDALPTPRYVLDRARRKDAA